MMTFQPWHAAAVTKEPAQSKDDKELSVGKQARCAPRNATMSL